MSRVFNYDNGFFRFMGKFVDVFFLSVLWVIYSLPLITIGASTQALYYTVHKQIRGNRGYVWQEFWDSFRDQLGSNIVLTLIYEVLLGILSYERMLLKVMVDNGGGKELQVMLYITVFVQFVFLTWAIFTFCYRARFTMDAKNSVKNGLLLMFGYLPQALIVLLLLPIAVLIVYLVPFLVFLVPVLLFLVYERVLEKIFRSIMSPEDLAKEEELQMENDR